MNTRMVLLNRAQPVHTSKLNRLYEIKRHIDRCFTEAERRIKTLETVIEDSQKTAQERTVNTNNQEDYNE